MSANTKDAISNLQDKVAKSQAVKDFARVTKLEKLSKNKGLKENIKIPQNPNPVIVAKLIEAHEAPNPILRVLLASALQQQHDHIPAHAVNLLNCLAESKIIDV